VPWNPCCRRHDAYLQSPRPRFTTLKSPRLPTVLEVYLSTTCTTQPHHRTVENTSKNLKTLNSAKRFRYSAKKVTSSTFFAKGGNPPLLSEKRWPARRVTRTAGTALLHPGLKSLLPGRYLDSVFGRLVRAETTQYGGISLSAETAVRALVPRLGMDLRNNDSRY
jgi:hypothetical protein